MNKLRICLVTLTFAPDSQDGSAKFITGLYKYLRSMGHDVTVITGRWNLDIKDENVIQLKIIKNSFLWIPQFVIQVFKYLKKNKFDIIHGNGPKGSLPLLINRNPKFISTIHDLGPIEFKSSKIPIEKYLIKRTIEKSIIVTTCSESIKKQILQTFQQIPSDKIVNVFSAIESKFRPHPAKANILKEKLNLKGPTLLYIGRIARYKGVPEIIKAYQLSKKKIRNLELVIGGKPDFSMRETYENWKVKYDNVQFVGFIPSDEIAYYYTMADIFITYSQSAEGFGLTPIEAIACGTPVILSDIKVFREVLQDNAIFVPPQQPEKLSEAICDLLKDNELQEKLILKAQNYIKRYSWSKVGEKIEKIYSKIYSVQ